MTAATELDLRTATDVLAAAAALGMTVPAPTGTTVYTFYAPVLEHDLPVRRGGQLTAPAPGLHTNYDTALQALAAAAIAVHDTKRRVAGAPWGCRDFFTEVTSEQWRADMPGWLVKHRTAQDQARDSWLEGRTPLQVVHGLVGTEDRDWAIRAITVHR